MLVGSDFEYGIEQYYIKYLRQLGCEIIHYAAPDIVFRQRSGSLMNKALFKSGLLTGYRAVNRELIRLAEHHHPDVIWVFKGMEIYPSTLARLGRTCKLANYNPDHPFIISGSGSGNKNVTNSVGLYHLHFCYNRNLQKQIEDVFKIKTVYLPFGFELIEEEFLIAEKEPEVNKICFIGNPGKTRVDMLTFLAKNGFGVDVYGHDWERTALKKLERVQIYDAVYGKEFWKKLRQYRVQINIFRKHNVGSHNMRSFEIPAVGGIQLAPYNEEQSVFFSEGKEIFFYRNEKDILEKVKEILSTSIVNMEVYRKAARKRSLQSGYSYRDRAAIVYENFIKLIG